MGFKDLEYLNQKKPMLNLKEKKIFTKIFW